MLAAADGILLTSLFSYSYWYAGVFLTNELPRKSVIIKDFQVFKRNTNKELSANCDLGSG